MLERNRQDRIEKVNEMPSLVKGRKGGIQKDDQARGSILLILCRIWGLLGEVLGP